MRWLTILAALLLAGCRRDQPPAPTSEQSGQLDDAPLTLRDLDRVKREFARVMYGTYHKRIGYPRPSGGIAPEFQSVERE